MSRAIYLRIAGYLVTILLHGGNLMVVTRPPSKEVLEDIRIRKFSEMQFRYLTSWTFTLQIVYGVIGLVCDLLTLKNSKTRDYKLPKYVKGFRDTLFAGIVWPSSLVVFIFFWCVFIYDRSLVYPDFLDKVLSPVSNHIMHTAILPIVLWEILFQPRTKPQSHMRYFAHMTFHFAFYLGVLIYTYVEKGIWLYPILKEFYGTMKFPLMCLCVYVLASVSYYLQWILPSFVSVPEKTKKKHR
ncbi:unnamed protein product [Diatraea saccharalis]|uniref:Androgen-dependent TFPI-regulating protein n=1 Tax=Diatraea saccharalis TaxID=40085 RepID=A0A9N9WIF6_9NEOP|nr:unnamed protein product [Diatraea saccharalis]